MSPIAVGLCVGGLIGFVAFRYRSVTAAARLADTPVLPTAAAPAPGAPDFATVLHAVLPGVDAATWLPALSAAFAKYRLDTPLRIAAAMGQFVAEAGDGLSALRENMNYTAAELLATFPHEIPDHATAERYAGDAEAIGNVVYAGRNGNGDAASGDGYRFRGGGLAQLTGRANYQAFATAAGMDVDAVPDYVATAAGAALSGCWYFSAHGCLPLADAWRLDDITRIVNGGGMLGQATRSDYATRFREAFGVSAPGA